MHYEQNLIFLSDISKWHALDVQRHREVLSQTTIIHPQNKVFKDGDARAGPEIRTIVLYLRQYK